MPSTTGRRVVVGLTNKSGGGVILGDVVIIDTSNDSAFTTTTSAASTVTIGVAQETIANNATGLVLLEGETSLVNVSASVTRGHYGATHTVAKQAAGQAARGSGTFVQFTTGGTTPKGIVYPTDLLGTSLTNPMTTAGDMIVGGASGAPARLAAGTAGYYLAGGGAGVASAYAKQPIVQIVTATSTADDADTTASIVNSSLSLAITPLFADSILHIRVDGEVQTTRVAGTLVERFGWVGIYNSTNTTEVCREVRGGRVTSSADLGTHFDGIALNGYYTVNSTAARTFVLRFMCGVATNLSTTITGSRTGGVKMTIMEVRP